MTNNVGAGLKATASLLALVILVVIACSRSDSALDRYSESMNPVLQHHLDLFTVDFAAILSAVDTDLEAVNSADDFDAEAALQLIDTFAFDLRSLSTEMSLVAQDWQLLEPPERAVEFHKLVLEVMQKRITSVDLTRVGYGLLAEVQVEASADMIQDAVELSNEADRLFVDVLAEARKLGGIEISR